MPETLIGLGQERMRPGASVLWARGFRPFFLACGAYGLIFVGLWLGVWTGRIGAPAWLVPTWWHAHEMIFGFALAAVAGFLLTAVPVWTRSVPVAGGRLAALVGLWLAGRVAFALAGWLPALAVAVADLAFLPALVSALAPSLLRAPWRNRAFLGVLAALFAANGVIHLQAVGVLEGGAAAALRLAVGLVALLIVIVGGRITPAFTANALRRAGIDAPVRSRRWADRGSLLALAVFLVADQVAPRTVASGVAALVAGGLVAARMAGWQSLRALRDPLVASLHAGYAWVATGLALVGVADATGAIPWTAGLHALTAGAMGTMILAVMTRVALGHTGRALVAAPGVVWIYGLISAGALLRVIAPLGGPVTLTLLASGVLWSGAFALFLVIHAPILLRPRVDGLPG